MPDFISEPVDPVLGTFDTSAMSRSEPGLPSQFVWRGTAYTVARTMRSWKSSSSDRGELYLWRHWHEVRTACGKRMVLYCERQAKTRTKPKRRWWLYSVEDGAPCLPL